MKVGEIVYMTNWYYLPVKKILDLILIIGRSSMVIQLTAGKIIQMSIHTFGDVSCIVSHIQGYPSPFEKLRKLIIPGDEIGLRVSECVVANDVINKLLTSFFLLVYFCR